MARASYIRSPSRETISPARRRASASERRGVIRVAPGVEAQRRRNEEVQAAGRGGGEQSFRRIERQGPYALRGEPVRRHARPGGAPVRAPEHAAQTEVGRV